MKAFYRGTFSICLFLAVILMIAGIAAANQSWIWFRDIHSIHAGIMEDIKTLTWDPFNFFLFSKNFSVHNDRIWLFLESIPRVTAFKALGSKACSMKVNKVCTRVWFECTNSYETRLWTYRFWPDFSTLIILLSFTFWGFEFVYS